MRNHPRLNPASRINIPTDPDRTIESVEFDYDCSFYLKAFAWLCIDGSPSDIRHLTECPCTWKLNRKVQHLELLSSISLQSECLHTQVQYEQEEWTPVTPNESYPLPTEPPEISRITFDAKTDPGTTSTIELITSGFPIKTGGITDNPKTVDWDLGTTYSVEDLSLTNTGSNTIYIRNLRTESVWEPYAPGDSVPLPPDPPEISKITFEAKTDAGTTSKIELFTYGVSVMNKTITAIPETVVWNLAAIIPADQVAIKNTGSSTIYIRNLTTE